MEWRPRVWRRLSGRAKVTTLEGEQFRCALCRGKGVVSTREYGEVITKATGGDLGWVTIRAGRAMAIKTIKGHDEKPVIRLEAEPTPISLQQLPLLAYSHEADEGKEAVYFWQPQQKRGTTTVSPASVSGLVRRLMATERARILGGKAMDLGRHTLGKRSQRWRQSRKRFK